jgi:hypothetical protein
MTSTAIDSRAVLGTDVIRWTPALVNRPHEDDADIGLTGVFSGWRWDPDIDRWTNEGGAIFPWPAHHQR